MLKRLLLILSFLLTLSVSPSLTMTAMANPAPRTSSSKAKKTTKTNKSKPKTSKSRNNRRSATTVKREQQQNERDIANTRRAINDNKRRVQENFERLNNLDAQITRQETAITLINAHLDSITQSIAQTQDTLTILEAQVKSLRLNLKKNLREIRSWRQRINTVAFIFSSKDFNTASRRYNYLKDLRKSFAQKTRELRRVIAVLDNRRLSLTELQNQHASALSQLNVARQVIAEHHSRAQQLSNQLAREGNTLQQLLNDKRRQAGQLERELDRLMATDNSAPTSTTRRNSNRQTSQPPRQQHADSHRSLSGSFEKNKGRLLFPVAGNYTIVGTFGTSGKYRDLNTSSPCIHIAVNSGTKVRAIFDGVVYSKNDGEGNMICIQHGNYYSCYRNITNITVSIGAKVKAGDNIATVARGFDGRYILVFGIFKNGKPLNPLNWVRS